MINFALQAYEHSKSSRVSALQGFVLMVINIDCCCCWFVIFVVVVVVLLKISSVSVVLRE